VSRSLLDINVLLALLDSDHIDHERAHQWLGRDGTDGWSSCPITENGFVRIISQPRYPSPIPAAEAIGLLARARVAGDHEFWPCDISLLDSAVVDPARVLGPRRVTDTYLLALAKANGGRFATFDRSVDLASVPGATAADLVEV